MVCQDSSATQEQIQHEQGVQGDTDVAARWSWKTSVGLGTGQKITVLHYWFLHIAVDSLIELAEEYCLENRD